VLHAARSVESMHAYPEAIAGTIAVAAAAGSAANSGRREKGPDMRMD
jgi:hypothetical protein